MLSLSSNRSKTSLTYTGGGMAAKGQRLSYKQCYYGRSKGQRLEVRSNVVMDVSRTVW